MPGKIRATSGCFYTERISISVQRIGLKVSICQQKIGFAGLETAVLLHVIENKHLKFSLPGERMEVFDPLRSKEDF
jgi:hypothetical protein